MIFHVELYALVKLRALAIFLPSDRRKMKYIFTVHYFSIIQYPYCNNNAFSGICVIQ